MRGAHFPLHKKVFRRGGERKKWRMQCSPLKTKREWHIFIVLGEKLSKRDLLKDSAHHLYHCGVFARLRLILETDVQERGERGEEGKESARVALATVEDHHHHHHHKKKSSSGDHDHFRQWAPPPPPPLIILSRTIHTSHLDQAVSQSVS